MIIIQNCTVLKYTYYKMMIDKEDYLYKRYKYNYRVCIGKYIFRANPKKCPFFLKHLPEQVTWTSSQIRI